MNKSMDTLKLVSRRKAIKTMIAISDGHNHFSDIMFKTKTNPGMIKRLIDDMTTAGWIEKNDHIYTLTEKGRKICTLATEIIKID